MDFSDFQPMMQAQEEGVEVQIRHPVTNAPTDAFIRVVGVDSIRARKARQAAIHALATRKAQGEDIGEDADLMTFATIARMIVGWRGVQEGGNELAFTAETAEGFLRRYPFVCDQLDAASGRRATFLDGSSGGSAKASGKG